MKLRLLFLMICTQMVSMHATLPDHIIIITHLYDATLKKKISSYSYQYHINKDGSVHPGITTKSPNEDTQYTASLILKRINANPLKASLSLSLLKENAPQFQDDLDIYILEASSTNGITQRYTDCAAHNKQLSLTIHTLMGASYHDSEKTSLNL